MEISEISENNLKAIVGGRQVVEMNWVGGWAEKVAEKPQGEGKAASIGLGSSSRMAYANLCPVLGGPEDACGVVSFTNTAHRVMPRGRRGDVNSIV